MWEFIKEKDIQRYQDENEVKLLQEYDKFFKDNFNVDAHVFLNNLVGFSSNWADKNLGNKIMNELAECERMADSDRYMKIIKKNREKLDTLISSFLYHRWIRILLLKKYSFQQKTLLENIPIAFLYRVPFLDAFIIKTQKEKVICFSYAFNMILLDVYQTILKASTEKEMTHKDAATRIISLGRFLARNCSLPVPEPLKLDYKRILYSDLLNNLLHMFVLSHEYNHFLLGHLQDKILKPFSIPGLQLKHIESYQNEVNKEIDADRFSMQILKESNDSKDSIMRNGFLLNSVIIFFKFICLYKRLLGYGDSSMSNENIRIKEMTKEMYGELEFNVILKELEIFDIAMDYV